MAISILHATSSATADDGTSDVGSAEWNAAHVVTGIREQLTADRTYYVRTDGSDSNTGLADTAGGAFLTIQHGLDVISQTLDLNIYNCTLQVRTGTFVGGAAFGPIPSAGGNLVIRGNGAANTIITTNQDHSCGLMVRGHAGNRCTIAGGWTFQGSNDGATYLRADGGCVTMFIAGALICTGDNPTDVFIEATDKSYVEVTSSSATIGGDLDSYMACHNSTIKHNGGVITLSSSPVFQTGFVDAIEGNSVICKTTTTFSGTATGPRFNIGTGATIITENDSLTYFPGDALGVSDGNANYNGGSLNMRAIPLTFAQLPATPLAGMMCYVTDSNTATWGATVASGGANKVLCWYNGTNWTVMGA
jgi:hypothetical protein